MDVLHTSGAPAGLHQLRGVTHDVFFREYVRRLEPEFFRKTHGDREVTVAKQPRRLGEVIDDILESTPARPGPYFHAKVPTDWTPNLLEDLTPPPKCITPHWATMPPFPKLRLFEPEILIGGAGTRFHVLHYDMFHTHGFLMQLHGEKRFIMYSPADSELLYPNPERPGQSLIANPDAVDLDLFPRFVEANPIECVLKPGETLFIPAGWWHTTELLTACTTLNFNTVNGANWRPFVDDFVAFTKRVRSRRRSVAIAVYLRAFGLVQRLRQAV
jgi:histone arginine demethylase JMJD6